MKSKCTGPLLIYLLIDYNWFTNCIDHNRYYKKEKYTFQVSHSARTDVINCHSKRLATLPIIKIFKQSLMRDDTLLISNEI